MMYQSKAQTQLVEEPTVTITGQSRFVFGGVNSVLFACAFAFAGGVVFISLLLLALKVELPPVIGTVLTILTTLLLIFLFGWFVVFTSLRLWHWHKRNEKASRQYKTDNGQTALVELETGGAKPKKIYFNPYDNTFIDPTATTPAQPAASDHVPQWMAMRLQEQRTARVVAVGNNSAVAGNVLDQEFGAASGNGNRPFAPSAQAAPGGFNFASTHTPVSGSGSANSGSQPTPRIWWLNREQGGVTHTPVPELLKTGQLSPASLRQEQLPAAEPERVVRVEAEIIDAADMPQYATQPTTPRARPSSSVTDSQGHTIKINGEVFKG